MVSSPDWGSCRKLRTPSQQPLSIGSISGGERADLRLELPHPLHAAALQEALEERQRLGERRARPLAVAGRRRRLAQLRERPGEVAIEILPATLARGLLEQRAGLFGLARVEREPAQVH